MEGSDVGTQSFFYSTLSNSCWRLEIAPNVTWLESQDSLQLKKTRALEFIEIFISLSRDFSADRSGQRGGLNTMNLSMESKDSTNAIPDSLLQTVGIMKHALRSMRYIEKRLCETMELSDVDPRLRGEMQSLFEATSDVHARLSVMSITVTEVLKEAVTGQSADPNRLGETKRHQGQARRGRNRLEIVRTAAGRA